MKPDWMDKGYYDRMMKKVPDGFTRDEWEQILCAYEGFPFANKPFEHDKIDLQKHGKKPKK